MSCKRQGSTGCTWPHVRGETEIYTHRKSACTDPQLVPTVLCHNAAAGSLNDITFLSHLSSIVSVRGQVPQPHSHFCIPLMAMYAASSSNCNSWNSDNISSTGFVYMDSNFPCFCDSLHVFKNGKLGPCAQIIKIKFVAVTQNMWPHWQSFPDLNTKVNPTD